MKLIPYNRQLIDKFDIRYILDASKKDLITTGIYNEKLELKAKKYFSTKYALSCNSGTSAIFIALKGLNLKKNDVVIMPSINFVSAANISKLLGAKIFFTDIDPNTGQMSSENLEHCIKKNKLKKIKVVFSMYLGGSPFFVKNIYRLKKKYKFLIIEDACHALGSKYKNKEKFIKVGSCIHSDICIFSLHPTKSITSGEGGLVLTNKKSIFDKLFLARNHGMKKQYKKNGLSFEYDITFKSLNFRLSDINAALAYSQFFKIDKFVNKRNYLVKGYFSNLNPSKYYDLPKKRSDIKSAWHLFPIKINSSKKMKEKLILFLYKNKILTQIHYKPIYKFTAFKYLKKVNKVNFVGAEEYYKKTLSVPLHLHLNAKKIAFICNKLDTFFKKNKF
jgi:dTDP-4-amino-4,6-dideoxygalactose transaminase